jgi:hypothetical protein
MKISLALGLALVLALGAYFGFADIATGLRSAGWGVLAVIAFHPLQMIFSALAWQALVPAPPTLGLTAFVGLRWIREGVNNLLPVAQIGGEFVAARLLRRAGVPVALATPDGRELELAPDPAVRLVGTPGELVLLAFGRGAHAAVRREGDSRALAALAAADLSV